MMQKKRILVFSTFIFFIISHIYLISIMTHPYIGIDVYIDPKGDHVIEKIHNNDGWARTTDLIPGDIILEVDNQKISEANSNLQYNCFIHGKEIKIERDNEIKYFKTSNTDLSNFLKEMLIPGVFTLLTFFLSIFMYQKNSDVVYNLILFLLSASLSFFASTESGRGEIIANIIISISLPLGSLYLNLFITALLFEKGLIKRKMALLVKLNILMCLATISFRLISLLLANKTNIFSANILLAYFCLSVLYSIILLIYFYITKRNSHHEIFLKWMLLINVAAFIPFIFLHAIPFILETTYIKDDIAALFLFTIPLGYFYLVMTKQLIDINLIFKQIPYYIVISSIPAICITSIVIIQKFYVYNIILLFSLILTLNVIFLFLKEKVDFSFQNNLFYNKANLSHKLNEFTQKLTSAMNQRELEQILIHQIQEVLDPQVLNLIKFKCNTLDYETNYFGHEDYHFVLSDQIKSVIQSNSHRDLIEYKGFIGIEIHRTNDIKSYLWIGYKKNNTFFNTYEKIWIINIVRYLRLVYENLNMVENIVASIKKKEITNHSPSLSLSRFLFKLGEQERRRLASDLHDSALQDQIIWYRKLQHLINDNENIPKYELEQLNKIRNGMGDVISQIRNTCNELRPHLLFEIGLIKSLEELCEQKKLKVSFYLEYEFHFISDYLDNFNITISIYRVFQEMLNNAEKHSKASRVSISMWEDNNNIYLDYRDNGIGFNVEQKINDKQIGLTGLKERISSLNGTIKFLSEEGHGLQIDITIPRWAS